MINCPNAKINLGLKIESKRADSFHNLSGYFFPIAFSDILEINPSDESDLVFKTSGIKVPGDKNDNLVLKAYEILKSRFNLPNVYIHLHKQIPFGAGLGGGSSDASHALNLLNKLFELELDNEELKKIAVKIGADCSFFIDNKAAFVSGIGDKIETIDNFLKGKHIKLFKPEFAISTTEAYSGVKISGDRISKYDFKNVEFSDMQTFFKNDFEQHLFKKYPLLSKIKTQILNSGAFYASMTGSGSAIYGLYDSDLKIDQQLEKFLIWKGEA